MTAWEEDIRNAPRGRLVVYKNSSRDLVGRVVGRWYTSGNGAGNMAVGSLATV